MDLLPNHTLGLRPWDTDSRPPSEGFPVLDQKHHVPANCPEAHGTVDDHWLVLPASNPSMNIVSTDHSS